jgi:hypothetical protein
VAGFVFTGGLLVLLDGMIGFGMGDFLGLGLIVGLGFGAILASKLSVVSSLDT